MGLSEDTGTRRPELGAVVSMVYRHMFSTIITYFVKRIQNCQQSCGGTLEVIFF